MDKAFYDYCICFADQPSNREIANKLILEVSSYKLPRKVKDFDGEPAYTKGCLLPLSNDAPLTNEQENILKSCRWLMILCTKQARQAFSINQAIHFFILNKGRSYILPILFEGEPQEAFPPEFFEERTSTVTFSAGSVQNITEVIEPLAIDIRAKDLKTSLSLLRHARIKVVAALIGVSYDKLEQRHERRARRRLKTLAAICLSVPLALGVFFTYLWINAEYQIDIAIKKTQVSKDLLANMCRNYPELFKDIPGAEPILNALLIDSLEKLRVVESEYIPMLGVDDLLLPDAADDIIRARNKAKLLRYLGKVDEAVEAYEKVSSMLEQNNEVYRNSAVLFANMSPADYPSGVIAASISEDNSTALDGLRSGDIIVQTKGFNFRSLEQYEIHRQSLPPDQNIEIRILRPQDGSLIEMTLKIKPKDLIFASEEI